MLGNMALQSPLVTPIVTATGNVTVGYNQSGATPNVYPSDLIPISAASAVTLTLPSVTVALNTGALGIGGSQTLRVMNLNSQAVTLAGGGAGPDTILGSSATIAANATAVLISDPANARWFRISG